MFRAGGGVENIHHNLVLNDILIILVDTTIDNGTLAKKGAETYTKND